MHVLVFQHVPFEDLGAMAPWLDEHGARVQVIHQYEPDSGLLPELSAVDLVIVLGGPMSVHDTTKYPWLDAEKAYIRSALHAKTPMLGLCLGAQLIAEQLSATVQKNHLPEIGWWPVYWHRAAQSIWPEQLSAMIPTAEDPVALTVAHSIEEVTRVFHWHGETFDLPDEAQSIAHSQACANQGFMYRNHVVGLQFHLEMTPDTVARLLREGADDLIESPYVATEQQIKSEPPETYAINQRFMSELLEFLVLSPR